jgi:hypothetical protein
MPPITKTTDQGPAEERPGQYASPHSDAGETGSRAPLYGAGDRAASARADDPATATTDTMAATGTATRASEPAPAPVGLVAAGDRCANCGAPLAPDQHYCLNCGERRGAARFTAASAGTGTTGGARPDPPPRGSRFSAGTTLIAGVATLLLALGIGVLIGNKSASSSTPTNSKVQVVNLSGGSAGAASTVAPTTAAPTSNGGSSGSANKSSANSNQNSKASTSASSSTAAAASSATTAQKLPPATVTVGAKGSGAGYQHGKFTGNFFGP